MYRLEFTYTTKDGRDREGYQVYSTTGELYVGLDGIKQAFVKEGRTIIEASALNTDTGVRTEVTIE